jgi:hypothetical protein
LDHDSRLIRDTQAKYGLSPQENVFLQALGEMTKPSSAENIGTGEKKDKPAEAKK